MTSSSEAGTFDAYLAQAPVASAPAIILLQEIFGVTAFLRDQAERLAADGYLVVAPDLFWRTEPGIQLSDQGADLDRALALGATYDLDQGVRDVADTISTVAAMPEHAGGVAVIGFCLGGTLALGAGDLHTIHAVVSYYPVRIGDRPQLLSGARVPSILHLGANDELCPAETQHRLRNAAPSHVDIYTYPGAGHAFANPARATHDPTASATAYSRTLTFLRRTLGPFGSDHDGGSAAELSSSHHLSREPRTSP